LTGVVRCLFALLTHSQTTPGWFFAACSVVLHSAVPVPERTTAAHCAALAERQRGVRCYARAATCLPCAVPHQPATGIHSTGELPLVRFAPCSLNAGRRRPPAMTRHRASFWRTVWHWCELFVLPLAFVVGSRDFFSPGGHTVCAANGLNGRLRGELLVYAAGFCGGLNVSRWTTVVCCYLRVTSPFISPQPGGGTVGWQGQARFLLRVPVTR